MEKEGKHVISLEIDAEGVPQTVTVNGETFTISAEQKQQGEELMSTLAKAAGTAVALQTESVTLGRI